MKERPRLCNWQNLQPAELGTMKLAAEVDRRLRKPLKGPKNRKERERAIEESFSKGFWLWSETGTYRKTLTCGISSEGINRMASKEGRGRRR